MKTRSLRYLGLLIVSSREIGAAVAPRQAGLPTVDLGYAVHQATMNTNGNYYTFKNIRYAAPPIGELRWKAPIPPSTTNRSINTGDGPSPICSQSYPEWILGGEAARFGLDPRQVASQLVQDPRITEDCLFLDIHVPVSILERGDKNRDNAGAAVLVWIHGGGFVTGYKDVSSTSPTGLLARSQEGGREGIIFVSLNYRLGVFGWLDPGRDSNATVLPNAGLWDQALALDWVRRYVHLFGGDPSRVTVMGQSAGASSIMFHLSAFGGGKNPPFAQAIIQSPAWSTTPDVEDTWERTLAAAARFSGREIATVEQLRGLNTSVLLQVNQEVTFASFAGGFTYGPTIDGGFVPSWPGVLFLEGRFNSHVAIMAGHNSNESAGFAPPIRTSEDVIIAAEASFPTMSAETKKFILEVLYPDVLDGSYGYTTQLERALLLGSEAAFSCNTRYLGTAYGNRTFSYVFKVPPGVHGQDVPYTFFDETAERDGGGAEEDNVVVPEVALAMQEYFTAFVATGRPEGATLSDWSLYGDEARVMAFGVEGEGMERDEMANPRCEWWQRAVYLQS